jgi:hypothetical protein
MRYVPFAFFLLCHVQSPSPLLRRLLFPSTPSRSSESRDGDGEEKGKETEVRPTRTKVIG